MGQSNPPSTHLQELQKSRLGHACFFNERHGIGEIVHIITVDIEHHGLGKLDGNIE